MHLGSTQSQTDLAKGCWPQLELLNGTCFEALAYADPFASVAFPPLSLLRRGSSRHPWEIEWPVGSKPGSAV